MGTQLRINSDDLGNTPGVSTPLSLERFSRKGKRGIWFWGAVALMAVGLSVMFVQGLSAAVIALLVCAFAALIVVPFLMRPAYERYRDEVAETHGTDPDWRVNGPIDQLYYWTTGKRGLADVLVKFSLLGAIPFVLKNFPGAVWGIPLVLLPALWVLVQSYVFRRSVRNQLR